MSRSPIPAVLVHCEAPDCAGTKNFGKKYARLEVTVSVAGVTYRPVRMCAECAAWTVKRYNRGHGSQAIARELP